MSQLKRPFTLMKAALSLDGFLDDLSDNRLILSSPEDRDAVDLLKSTFDAILVGAETVRKDNPSLLIRSEIYRKKRLEKGLPEHPVKVTLTMTGNLDPASRFFQEGSNEKWVYCPESIQSSLQARLGDVSHVIGLARDSVQPEVLLEDLKKRGISSLLIEGGTEIHSLFLKRNLIDAIRIAIAPFFVGEQGAPRLIGSGKFPYHKDNRMKLSRVETLGDIVVAHYERSLK